MAIATCNCVIVLLFSLALTFVAPVEGEKSISGGMLNSGGLDNMMLGSIQKKEEPPKVAKCPPKTTKCPSEAAKEVAKDTEPGPPGAPGAGKSADKDLQSPGVKEGGSKY